MADRYDFTLDQGSDWYLNITYKDSLGVPINLTGYTAALQFRLTPSDSTAALTLTSISGITITPLTGTLDIHATATQTAALAAGKYSYDLELNNGGVVTRIIQGTCTVSAEVTRV